ncbi:MAG: energy transducer TonB [Candidatus Methylomirabilota bacterium]
MSDLLRAIRRRIEEAKVYPDSARRAGLEGTAEIAFRIGPDGSPVGIELVRSSGHAELDRISQQTIERAAPYPVLPGRIRIPLAYRLD